MLTPSAGEAVARSESFELEKLPATACLTVHWPRLLCDESLTFRP